MHEGFHRSLDEAGHRRLRHEAQSQRRHGDAELGAGQLPVEVAHGRQCHPGPAVAGFGQRLQAGPPGGDERELHRHEPGIGHQQHHRNHDVQRGHWPARI